MADHTLDAPTLAFLSRLPLVLSPRPRLSSAAAHHLAAATQGAHSAGPTTGIQCCACRAQLVGGVNSSVWVEHGELWSACGGCGSVSRRATEAASSSTAASATAMGKGAFERVKKRRRVAVQRRDEAAHPTALTGSTRPAHILAALSRSAAGPDAVDGRARRPGRVASAASAAPPSSTTTASPLSAALAAGPASSRPTPTSAVAPPRPTAPSLAPSRPTSTSSTARSNPSSLSTSTSPAPASARAAASPAPLAADAATKKRKRPKQPSGLAELLEAKKKREQGEKAAGGGLGLAGFLQGL
ncbi:hypothetical protein JCM9279_005719 [Rhodotorula babjevae]